MRFLLDTNVVSELRKRERADAGLLAWSRAADASWHHLSVVTILELEVGILLAERKDPDKGAHLRRWLDTGISRTFDGRVLPIDDKVARRCASLHVPDRRPERDAYIAATALVHGMTIVTRNTMNAYRELTGKPMSLFDAIAPGEPDDFDFEPPRLTSLSLRIPDLE